VLARTVSVHVEALDYAAAIDSARRRLATGDPAGAARSLVRAYAHAPLDADVFALESLRAEVEGRDADAARGYRATLALRHEESAEPPDPHDGLARLASFGDARPVATLSDAFRAAPVRIVVDPVRELAAQTTVGATAPLITVFALAIADGTHGAVYLRASGVRAFATITTDLRAERAAPLLAAIGGGPLTVEESGPDVLALSALREEHRRKAP
jgi:hypothetical protein